MSGWHSRYATRSQVVRAPGPVEFTNLASNRLIVRYSAPVAVGLSALVEGLGQAYNRQSAKATGFLVAELAWFDVSIKCDPRSFWKDRGSHLTGDVGAR